MPESTDPRDPRDPDRPIDPDRPAGTDRPADSDDTIIVGGGAGPRRDDAAELTGPDDHLMPENRTVPHEGTSPGSDIELVASEPVADEPVAGEPVARESEQLRVVPVEPYYADFPEQDTPEEIAEEAAKRPRPERLKRAAVVGARVVTGTVGVLLAAAVVTAAALVPLPSYTAEPASLQVTPVETGQQLICPGSVLALSESADTAASATTSLGDVAVVSGSTSGTLTDTALPSSDASSGGTEAAPQLLTAEADPSADQPLLLAGAQSQVIRADEFFGLAATSCAVPSADSWLVGGATTTGRSTLITLSNPSTVAADVDLEIYSEIGAISAPGLTEISVAPGAQRVLSLAGFAPQAASPVVHVRSEGGLVVASLQQTTTRGIEAGGLDLVGASAEPSATTVIPGVTIGGSEAVASRLGSEGFEDLTPALRIFNPAAEAVEARVAVQLEGGTAEPANFEVEVAGGVVVDFPIDDLTDGNYSITVESDTPVVAGARAAAVGSAQVGGRADFAWFASAAQLLDDALVSVPRSVGAALNLANPTGDEITVAITAIAGSASAGTQGATRRATVPANGSAVLPAEAGATYQLADFTALHVSVSAAVDGGVAGYPVVPTPEASAPITIYP
ncbi:DUF5719 family protein [Glaciihabitans tibetensis]|nr:DUF5719 family protein [Glaciihabitans tibetensis]